MTLLGKNLKVKEVRPFGIERRVISTMTMKGWQEIPHFGMVYEPDVTEFMIEFQKFREEFAKKFPTAPKLTVNTIILKVISEGLVAAPELNAYFEYNKATKIGTPKIIEDINISMPWALPDGRMFTPVIPNIEKKSIKEIADCIADMDRRLKNTNIEELLYEVGFSETLAELKAGHLSVLGRVFANLFGKNKLVHLKGKEKEAYYSIPLTDRLGSADILNGTIIVSNIGSLNPKFRGTVSLIDIVPPQVSALAVGSIQEKPGIYVDTTGKKQIGIRKTLPLTGMFDHRWLDTVPVMAMQVRLDEIFAHPKVFFQEMMELSIANESKVEIKHQLKEIEKESTPIVAALPAVIALSPK